MTNLLARRARARVLAGPSTPLVAPFLGALGAFITGSNNNSNVLFAVLQMRTAELLQSERPADPGGADRRRLAGQRDGARQGDRRLQHGGAGR